MLESLVRAELDHRAADVLVDVVDVDVVRACLVGGAREGARERRVLDSGVDEDVLAGSTFAPTPMATAA